MAGYRYADAAQILQTGEPTRLQNVATNWTGFASACERAATRIKRTSGDVTEQHGAAYQNFGTRADEVVKWLTAVAGIAGGIAESLTSSGGTGVTAQFRRDEIVRTYEHQEAGIRTVDSVNSAFTFTSLPPGGSPAAQAQVNEAQNAAAQRLNAEIDKWSAAYQAFTIEEIPPAPGSSGGSVPTQPTAGPVGSGESAVGGIAGSDAAPTATGPTLSADHPMSSVVGPEGGDFAGWVRDPITGYLVDPATGREFDPTTGRWIDPVTGRPFGDLAQYASRLEGLHGGLPTHGLLAPGGGVALAGGSIIGSPAGGYNFGALYGGVVPPSLVASNPATLQLSQQAARHLDVKSYAAQQLAAREAAPSTRPFVPPMAHGGAAGVTTSGNAAGLRYPGEPASVWTRRPAGSTNPGAAAELTGDALPAASSATHRRTTGGTEVQ